jgi:hypothetical protein
LTNLSTPKVIIDTNSISNFFRYYYFYDNKSKKEESKLFIDLCNFLVNEINKGNIIVIDKVDDELESSWEYKKFIYPKIKNKIFKTEYVFLAEITELSKNVIEKNKKDFTPEVIEAEINKFESVYADLYLIAYSIKNEGTILITDETSNENHNNKLFPKIPNLCKEYNVKWGNISYLLFNIYGSRLKFSLKID